ncbi:cytochrome c3 family protein [Campylobacter fetus]|uniref:cytochrome c3 family protein n=1 Tax=Campylobacter fetus TaxID=196 RepID=UPI000818C124|nr:NapC/NirT family cytochrome c [Campylobacter fetus]
MKKVLIIIGITITLTLVVVFGGYKVVEVTGDYPFCGSCHAWDGAIAQTNLADSVHGASATHGVKVKCSDCHLPHDSLIGYLFTKAKNGVAEGFTTMLRDPDKKDWLGNRQYTRDNYTFDSSCLKCHANILKTSDGNMTRAINKMHDRYVELKSTAEAMKCTDCHKHVGHKELGAMLYEQKFHQPNSWEEWEKARNK